MGHPLTTATSKDQFKGAATRPAERTGHVPSGVCWCRMTKKIASVGFCFACAVFSSAGASVQQPAEKLTLERLTTAAKHYFRDSAEFPLLQKTTFSVVEANGRARKMQTVSAEYVFRGYNRGTKKGTGHIHGEVSIWAGMNGAKAFKASTSSAVWAIDAGEKLYAEPGELVFEANETSSADRMRTATLTPATPCPTVTMKDHAGWYVPDHRCGLGEFQVHDDMSFQKYTFDLSGLPAPVEIDPFGPCILQRYHVEVEFQSVEVPGEKEPFLVPKLVTATLETNKGKTVIASVYEPKARAK